jgi:hypothetical protein
MRLPGWVLRVIAGLLVAGVLAPVTILLPVSVQRTPVLLLLAGACTAAALLVRRGPRAR